MLLVAFVALCICSFVKKYTNDVFGYNLSFIHALFQSVIGVALLPTLDFEECYEIINTRIPDFEISLIVLVVYLIFDLCANKCKNDIKIHHFTVLLVATLSFYFEYMHSVGALLLLNEISTIFLNMLKLNDEKPIAITTLFVITFFIFRVLLIPITLFIIFSCDSSYFVLFAISIHAILNFYWFIKILKKLDN